MSIVEGRDFVIADEVTYLGPAGMGKGCMLGTHDQLLLIPVEITSVSGYRRYTSETKIWSLEGKNPAEMVRNFVSDSAVNSKDLNGMMKDIASNMDGAVIHDLVQIRQLRVKNSFLSKGIYINKSDSKVGWKGYPLKKKDVLAFSEFYKGHAATQQ